MKALGARSAPRDRFARADACLHSLPSGALRRRHPIHPLPHLESPHMNNAHDLTRSHDADADAAPMDKETFALALRATLEEQLTLNHPIFLELFRPEKNRELLKVISLEGYQITRY